VVPRGDTHQPLAHCLRHTKIIPLYTKSLKVLFNCSSYREDITLQKAVKIKKANVSKLLNANKLLNTQKYYHYILFRQTSAGSAKNSRILSY